MHSVSIADVGFALQAATSQPTSRPTGRIVRGFLDFLPTTGWVGLVLLALLLAGIVLTVRRRLALSKARLAPPESIRRLQQAVQKRDLATIQDLGSGGGDVLLRLVRAAVARSSGETADRLEALDDAVQRETSSLQDGARSLLRLAIISTLLGAFGTTASLIAGFQMLAILKAPNPSDYATVVAEGLASLAFGLLFGVLLVVAFFWIRGRAVAVMSTVAMEAETIVRLVPEPPNPA